MSDGHEEARMKKRKRTKLVHEGRYVAEVDVERLVTDDEWAPYLSVQAAYKLDDVRVALKTRMTVLSFLTSGSLALSTVMFRTLRPGTASGLFTRVACILAYALIGPSRSTRGEASISRQRFGSKA